MTRLTRNGVSLLIAQVLLVTCASVAGHDLQIGAERGTASASLPATAYLCPMHPDVRSEEPGRCPRCSMALVAVGASLKTRYHLDVETTPRVLRSGVDGTVRFTVRESRTNTVVQKFEQVHERLFHLFVISQDLEHFAHLHPTLAQDGSLDVDVRLPRPAPYHFFADFLPAGGAPQLLHRALVSADYDGTLAKAARALPLDLSDKVVNGIRIRLETPEQLAGREQIISCWLEDATTGAPITDLEPYLGAWGHLLIVSWDLQDVVHSHPVAAVSDEGGPRIGFQQRFPRTGRYRMWAQFQRDGEIAIAQFTINVAETSVGHVLDVNRAGPVRGAEIDSARFR
jgi:hypothetical protein